MQNTGREAASSSDIAGSVGEIDKWSSSSSCPAGVSGGVAPVRRNASVRVCPGTSFFVVRGEGQESDDAVVLGVGATIGINGGEY